MSKRNDRQWPALQRTPLEHQGGRPQANPDEEPGYSDAFGAYVVCRELGEPIGYFSGTGDIAILDEPLADLLDLIQRGMSPLQASRQLRERYTPAECGAVMIDFELLQELNLLEPDPPAHTSDHTRRANQLLAVHPRKIMLLVTAACNLRCDYCYEAANAFHASSRMMAPEFARSVVDTFFRAGAGRRHLNITFFGGEPLLNFPAVQCATLHAERLARHTGQELSFSITTNLTRFSTTICRFLVDHDFSVMVSLDGNATDNDRHRKDLGGNGTYARVVANLEILLAAQRSAGRREACVRATLTAGSPGPIDVERHLRSLGIRRVMVGESTGTSSRKNAWDVTTDQALRVADELDQLALSYLASLRGEVRPDQSVEVFFQGALARVHEEAKRTQAFSQSTRQLCGVCRNMMAVTPSGDLYPCHRYVGMKDFLIGNIGQSGPNPDRMRSYYERLYSIYDLKCRRCWAKALCGGQCPWYLSKNDGTFTMPDEAGCRLIRRALRRSISLYAILQSEHPRALARILSPAPSSSHQLGTSIMTSASPVVAV